MACLASFVGVFPLNRKLFKGFSVWSCNEQIQLLAAWLDLDNLIILLDYMIILLLQVIENKEAPKLQEELVCEILKSTF